MNERSVYLAIVMITLLLYGFLSLWIGWREAFGIMIDFIGVLV